MLLAQAAAEYAVLTTVVDGFRRVYAQLEYSLGAWGTKGALVLVAVIVIWQLRTLLRAGR